MSPFATALIIVFVGIPSLFILGSVILFLYMTLAKHKEKHKELVALAHSVEPKFPPISAKPAATGSTPAEIYINTKFAEFIEAQYNFKKASSHAEFLKKKREAQEKLRMRENQMITLQEIQAAISQIKQFSNKLNDMRWKSLQIVDMELDSAFKLLRTTYSGLIDNTIPEDLGNFSSSSQWIQLTSKQWIAFENTYMIMWNQSRVHLSLLRYDAKILTVTSGSTTERLDWGESPEYSDEVAAINYLYERRDGGPDLRYNNNKSIYTIYRGLVSFCLSGGTRATIKFKTRKQAKDFEKAFNDICKIHEMKHTKRIDKLLSMQDVQSMRQVEQELVRDIENERKQQEESKEKERVEAEEKRIQEDEKRKQKEQRQIKKALKERQQKAREAEENKKREFERQKEEERQKLIREKQEAEERKRQEEERLRQEAERQRQEQLRREQEEKERQSLLEKRRQELERLDTLRKQQEEAERLKRQEEDKASRKSLAISSLLAKMDNYLNPKPARNITPRQPKKEVVSNEPQFTEEEIRLIMAMRKEKARQEEAVQTQQKDYENMVKLNSIKEAPFHQNGGNNVITNNLFGLNFCQDVADLKGQYELFFVSETGDTVSQISVCDIKGQGEGFRVSFELLPKIEFDSKKKYYLFVKLKDSEEIIGKLEYKINIAFVSDFDF